jgi:L-threonylcarbamoyladenylate synthase
MQLYNAASLPERDFAQILSFLRSGGVIGFPTDTAYGLGADPFNDKALRRIFAIKSRPENKPILLLVHSLEMAATVASLSERARSLAERFWPGPLTLILPARPELSDLVTAASGNIGIRWCNAPFALRLVGAFGKPVTATSANRSGGKTPVTAMEVIEQLGDRLEVLIDGGTLPAAGGSTVLDLTQDPPVLLRQGPVTFAQLSEALQGSIH